MKRTPTGFCFMCNVELTDGTLYCSRKCKNAFNRSMAMYKKCWSCNALINHDGRKTPTCAKAECKLSWYKKNPPPPVPKNWEPNNAM